MDYNLSDLDDKIEFDFLGFEMIYYPKIQEFAMYFNSGKFYFKEFHDKKNSSYFTLNGKKIFVLKHKLVYYVYNRNFDVLDKKLKIIHIDKNRNNNNIENLKIKYGNSKGCYYNKKIQKWMVYIQINKKLKYLGCFSSEEEAHKAYLNAKKILHVIN